MFVGLLIQASIAKILLKASEKFLKKRLTKDLKSILTSVNRKIIFQSKNQFI